MNSSSGAAHLALSIDFSNASSSKDRALTNLSTSKEGGKAEDEPGFDTR